MIQSEREWLHNCKPDVRQNIMVIEANSYGVHLLNDNQEDNDKVIRT